MDNNQEKNTQERAEELLQEEPTEKSPVQLEQRQREIADIIAREGGISTAQIQRKFVVGWRTAHRDLEVLESAGLCRRIQHGGRAIAPDSPAGTETDGSADDRDWMREPVEDRRPFLEERQREIADIIAREGSISTARIQGMYFVGYETARRDLEQLEREGLCKRTHGGAVAPLPDGTQVAVRAAAPRDFSSMPVFPEYLAIARKAAGYIRENDHVFITNGAIGHLMIRFLPTDFFYTVVVNSADMASELRAYGNFDTYVIGGKMRQSGSIVDASALEAVSKCKFDLCLLTGGGLSVGFGFSNGSGETVAFQRQVMANSQKRVLLIPGKKIGHDSFLKVCDIGEFGEIVTDWTADSALLEEIRAIVPALTVVEEEK